MSRILRLSLLGLLGLVLTVGVAGCGWLGASNAPRTKPDTFVLRGHVTVPVPAGDSRPDGAACASTLPDVVAGAPVRVTDPNGHELATGSLGDGIIASGSTHSCDFPFQIAAVPGGVDSYDVAVGSRPAQRFAAKQLRENAAAIITLDS